MKKNFFTDQEANSFAKNAILKFLENNNNDYIFDGNSKFYLLQSLTKLYDNKSFKMYITNPNINYRFTLPSYDKHLKKSTDYYVDFIFSNSNFMRNEINNCAQPNLLLSDTQMLFVLKLNTALLRTFK